MKKLSAFFVNPFLSTLIVRSSRENKQQHIAHSLAGFTQNPPAGDVFPPLIEAYRLACMAFSEMKGQTGSGMPLASSQRVAEVRKRFVVVARWLSSKVKVDFEADPAEYTTFFPQGLYKATLAKRGDVEGVIERWRKQVVANQGVMGDAAVTRITELKTDWNNATKEQSGYQSKSKMASTSVLPLWVAVAVAAYNLARALVDTNPQNPRILDVYFDFKMFTRRQNKDTDGKASQTGSVMHSVSGKPVARALLTFTHLGTGRVVQFRTNTKGLFSKHKLGLGLHDYTVVTDGYERFAGRANLKDAPNDPLHVVLVEKGKN